MFHFRNQNGGELFDNDDKFFLPKVFAPTYMTPIQANVSFPSFLPSLQLAWFWYHTIRRNMRWGQEKASSVG